MPGKVLWGLVVLSLAAGVLTLATIGYLLILFGVLLAALAPLRRRPRSFWPWFAGLVVFIGGYLLLAPANCSIGARSEVGGTQVEVHFCRSLAGIGYEQEGTEDPTQFPAFAEALAAGLLTVGVLRLILRRGEPEPEPGPQPLDPEEA
jgi:4-amino-4-deoxy-L-arabinose transferase-like glycosyltransferase